MEVVNWMVGRAALDPDAFGCAVIVAGVMILMVATALVYGFGRILYVQWRHYNRKKANADKKGAEHHDDARSDRPAA